MSLPKRYDPHSSEPELHARWQETGVYHFDAADSSRPMYSIDTPPPTVSGYLHLGHVYSYTQTDIYARFWRMRGHNVYYPMGYDDNGLPTERLVERRLGQRAQDVGRSEFIRQCLVVSEEAEQEYQALWQRLGLSVDWRYTYRTIDERSRRIAQWAFLDLHRRGLAYRQQAPAICCPECRTAIAQAEVNDLERQSVLYTLTFSLEDGQPLAIATTRPELLPACVAVFVHPGDARHAHLAGRTAVTPLTGQHVPILTDAAADPAKGTGVVMCCTFGDQADLAWWRAHDLPLVEAIGRDGRMTAAAGQFAGLPIAAARQQTVAGLEAAGLLLERQPISQTVRVHERCDTPVEYVMAEQWFVRVLDHKEALLAAGEQIAWHPAHMHTRYRQWVENLSWDWCISRQRAFGVPFPVWRCQDCGQVLLADEADLPVHPTEDAPPRDCDCGAAAGSSRILPDTDVMDTWATSSLSPQIAGQWLAGDGLYEWLFPFSLRPQGHEIIRTWAFYTIVQSLHHWQRLPWSRVAISGWGLAPEGAGKLSKSRGGGPMSPQEMIEAYSADAVRLWAASTGLGRDSVIDEARIQAGARLVTKLWNVARFAAPFVATELVLERSEGIAAPSLPDLDLTPADRWLLARLQHLMATATASLEDYDHAAALREIEAFFWRDLADNYLEMAKKRLYEPALDANAGARAVLRLALLVTLKLLAPFLPYVTETIYLALFAEAEGYASLHISPWPQPDPALAGEEAAAFGETLVAIAAAARRYKSDRALSMGAALPALIVVTANAGLAAQMQAAAADLLSVTRAERLIVSDRLPAGALLLAEQEGWIAALVDE